MNCLRMLHNNLVEGGNLVNTITGTTEVATMPVSNLLNSRKSAVWRSTTVASMQFISTTFNTTQTFNCIALFFTNLTANATISVRVRTLASDPNPTYISPTTPVLSNETSVSGIASTIHTYSYGAGTMAVVYFPEISGEQINVGILDTGNPDGYIEVGNLVIGKYWSPARNFEKGETWSIVDTGNHYRTDSADLLTEAGVKYRRIAFKLGLMESSDRDAMLNLLRANGKNRPIFMSLYPEDADKKKELMYTIQGKLEDLGQLDHHLTSYYSLPITIIEI